MSRKSSRRQSLVSILIKSSENVGLRLLSDEVKKAHKQQAEVINTRHQSEMELLADLVTFMRIKARSGRESNERHVKVLKILGNRSLRRLNWNKCKSIPEKSFLKLVAGEEARLARSDKTHAKIENLIERLIDFTNEKESNHARNMKMVTELNSLQRGVLADMVQADKAIVQLERKMKRKSDLDLDVKMAKTRQSFDVALRKFHAFTADWNQSKAFQITQHFSSGFIRITTDIIDQLRVILTENLNIELEALEILEQINLDINTSNIIATTSKKLEMEIETEIEPKLHDFDSSTEFVLQLHQDEIAKLDTRLNKLIEQKMMLTKMLYQESNPVPIMTVQASTSDIQDELFDCQRLILKTSMERNMKAAVINESRRKESLESSYENLLDGVSTIHSTVTIPPSINLI